MGTKRIALAGLACVQVTDSMVLGLWFVLSQVPEPGIWGTHL